MNRPQDHSFPGVVTVFRDRNLPEPATPVGYAALIEAFRLDVPLPRTLAAIGRYHRQYEEDGWRLYTPTYAPPATLKDHLVFALKHEGLDLAVLKKLFLAVSPEDMENMVQHQPTGQYARRMWFLYEWLLDARLNLPDLKRGSYVDAVDTRQQYAVTGVNSRRHRVRDNLPGTPAFCPLVFRTDMLERSIGLNLGAGAAERIARVPRDVLARTAAFLLLKDSRSSYAIEGERAPQNRIQRWGRAIGQAGQRPLDLEELLRLQRLVIDDTRFLALGLRRGGGFVGEHDRLTGTPLPDHISARAEDLDTLMHGLLQFDNQVAERLDAVIAAAVLAFGFVYIHPFEDGNGRLHRYLIHHVLTRRGFNPPGVVFPVSAVILDRIDDYRSVLEDYSQRLLPVIRWQPTPRGGIAVKNDTGDFYRFFDATPQAEFLYDCVQQTVEVELPREVLYLQRYDRFCAQVQEIVDMPDRLLNRLFRFLRQNDGRLSRRALDKEFAALTEDEARHIEGIYAACFDDVEQARDEGSE